MRRARSSPFSRAPCGSRSPQRREARGNRPRIGRRRRARRLAAGRGESRRAARGCRVPRRGDLLRAGGGLHEACAVGRAQHGDCLREPGLRGARADAVASVHDGSWAADGACGRQRAGTRDRIHRNRLSHLLQAHRRRRPSASADRHVPDSAVRRAVGRALSRRALTLNLLAGGALVVAGTIVTVRAR